VGKIGRFIPKMTKKVRKKQRKMKFFLLKLFCGRKASKTGAIILAF
jgi:hypothetical protein